MKYLDYAGLQLYDALIKQYIQDNIPDSSQAADVATALKNAANPNSNIKIAICTQAEYNALQNPEANVLYIISDETSEVVNVEANPTLDGTETVLSSIKIGGVKYKMPSIVANETLSGNETTVTSLTINGTKYAVPQGTIITANPTLAGTENDLESIGIGGVNYAIPSGGGSSGGGEPLYEHVLIVHTITGANYHAYIQLIMVLATDTPPTVDDIYDYLYAHNYYDNKGYVYASGRFSIHPKYYNVSKIYALLSDGLKYIGFSYIDENLTEINENCRALTASYGKPTILTDAVRQITTGAGGGSSSGGTSVEANPTLDGTETTLTGLGIDGTNYAMPHLYIHEYLSKPTDVPQICVKVLTSSSTQLSTKWGTLLGATGYNVISVDWVNKYNNKSNTFTNNGTILSLKRFTTSGYTNWAALQYIDTGGNETSLSIQDVYSCAVTQLF